MLSRAIAVLGGLVGFYVAGYTGVLLAVTNRPIWSDTPLLGMLFVISAASISAALMILLAKRSQWTMPAVGALHRMDAWVVALEFLVLIAVIISLGPVVRAWLSAWGLLLFVGVIVVGMLLPLALYLATAVARRPKCHDGCGLGSRRRIHSPAGHRPFGAASVI